MARAAIDITPLYCRAAKANEDNSGDEQLNRLRLTTAAGVGPSEPAANVTGITIGRVEWTFKSRAERIILETASVKKWFGH